MENKNNQHVSGGNAFILGVIVGVVITLLFTTKKGKEILRVLTEKGLSKFSDMEEIFDDEEESDEYVRSSQSEQERSDNEEEQKVPTRDVPSRQIPASSQISSGKRFFKKRV